MADPSAWALRLAESSFCSKAKQHDGVCLLCVQSVAVALDAARAEGERDMRERAAVETNDYDRRTGGYGNLCAAIRSLPLVEPDGGTGKGGA